MRSGRGKNILLCSYLLLFTHILNSCYSPLENSSSKKFTESENKYETDLTVTKDQLPFQATPIPVESESNSPDSLTDNNVCENRKGAALFEEIHPIIPYGKIAYSAGGIYLVNPNDNFIEEVYPIDSEKYPGRFTNLSWSPDGMMLAVIHKWYIQQRYSLEIVDFLHHKVCSILEERGRLSTPVWSPDGDNISVIDRESGELININLIENTLSSLDNSILISSSPQWVNETHIGFIADDLLTQIRIIYLLNIHTKEKVKLLAEKNLFTFLFSPDEKIIAYSEWDKFIINISNVATGAVRTADAYVPVEWTKDGKILLAETAGKSLVFINVNNEIKIVPVQIGGICTTQAFSSDDSMIVIQKEGNKSTSFFTILEVYSGKYFTITIPNCCSGDPVWNPKPGGSE